MKNRGQNPMITNNCLQKDSGDWKALRLRNRTWMITAGPKRKVKEMTFKRGDWKSERNEKTKNRECTGKLRRGNGDNVMVEKWRPGYNENMAAERWGWIWTMHSRLRTTKKQSGEGGKESDKKRALSICQPNVSQKENSTDIKAVPIW